VLAIASCVLVAACGGEAGQQAERRAEAPAAAGKAIYDTRCSPCHGMDGAGDGPAAAAITPKPRNFRDREFWSGRADAQLRMVVKEGRPGTLMPPFEGVVSDAEIDAVVAYLRTFRPAAP
jgi:cytochrome c oxidase cbb3-type subunit 2/cytochrome c oxidase cbb3-type subunit I/II